MSNEPTGEFFDTQKYQNPQQEWMCGHHADGDPCPIGPNGSGECLVAKICVPVRDENGSAWHCTRARVWGGKCQDGPIPDPNCPDQQAICPHQPAPCQPNRSLRGKRRLICGITAAAVLGFCLLVLGGSSGNSRNAVSTSTKVISPGPLSAFHATMNDGCAACHSAASASPLDVLNCVFGGNDPVAESQMCLKCHKDFGGHAMFAHSLDPNDLVVETERIAKEQSVDSQTTKHRVAGLLTTHIAAESKELACSICHKEHRGAAHDLTHLTNSQCQSCHGSSFHSFADGHPEFSKLDRAYIYFDHVTHLGTHFPDPGDERSEAFKCTDCHLQDATGTSMILARFENSCAKCHTGQLSDDHRPPELRMPGTAFLSLNKPNEVPPFTEIMLLSDHQAMSALATLRNSREHSSEVSAGDKASALQAYADSVEKLVTDLTANRELAVTTRLRSASGVSEFAAEQAEFVAERLAHTGFFSAVEIARKHWYPDSLQDQDAIDDDVESTDHSSEASTGAWEISDDGVISYRCVGHADPFLRDWISFAAAMASQYPEFPAAGPSGAYDRLFQQLAAPEATGRCMKCHTVDSSSRDSHGRGRFHVNWNSRQVLSGKREFTKFAHGPHVTLLSSESLAKSLGSSMETRCETCHGLMEQDSVSEVSAFLLDDWMPSPDCSRTSTIGIHSVARESCVKCHTPQAAGDNCLQCHNYHIHPTALHER